MSALDDAVKIAESYCADVPEHVDVTLDRNSFAAGYLVAAGGIRQALIRLRDRDANVNVVTSERQRQISTEIAYRYFQRPFDGDPNTLASVAEEVIRAALNPSHAQKER